MGMIINTGIFKNQYIYYYYSFAMKSLFNVIWNYYIFLASTNKSASTLCVTELPAPIRRNMSMARCVTELPALMRPQHVWGSVF